LSSESLSNKFAEEGVRVAFVGADAALNVGGDFALDVGACPATRLDPRKTIKQGMTTEGTRQDSRSAQQFWVDEQIIKKRHRSMILGFFLCFGFYIAFLRFRIGFAFLPAWR